MENKTKSTYTQSSSVSRVSEFLDSHQYPSMFFRHTWMVRLVQWFNMAVTLRNWYINRALSRILGLLGQRFSMLDAGCGLGEFALQYTSRFPDSSVLGPEISVANIELASSLARRSNLRNIVFEERDLTKFQPKNEFDLILCGAVLQSIQEDERVLSNLANALKTGGFLLIYTPVRYRRYFPHFAALEEKYLDRFFYRYGNGFSHHRYSASEVTSKIRKTGLNILLEEFSYGFCGAIAFEVYSLFLILLKRLPSALLLALVPVYAVLVFPFQLVLMVLDYVIPRNEGNGILVLARRT